MKSFAASLIFLLLTAGCVTVNCIYVTTVLTSTRQGLQEISEYTSATPSSDRTQDMVRDLFEYWNKHKNTLALTINTAELRDCTSALGNLVAFCDSETPSDFEAALSESTLRIDTLLSRERFSVENIL